jgi:hypothetical protein
MHVDECATNGCTCLPKGPYEPVVSTNLPTPCTTIGVQGAHKLVPTERGIGNCGLGLFKLVPTERVSQTLHAIQGSPRKPCTTIEIQVAYKLVSAERIRTSNPN